MDEERSFCTRCGIESSFHLCKDCRSVMTKKQVKKWDGLEIRNWHEIAVNAIVEEDSYYTRKRWSGKPNGFSRDTESGHGENDG